MLNTTHYTVKISLKITHLHTDNSVCISLLMFGYEIVNDDIVWNVSYVHTNKNIITIVGCMYTFTTAAAVKKQCKRKLC